MLEVAVALLGASLTFAAIGASGFALVGSVAALVMLSLAVSFGISRSLGLPVRMSILIACGNSICGNSAIAAVAPVIGASKDDVASSISFTAVLGVIVVLGLPLLIPLLQLTETQYGILAGMTVYAVPQVLAATVPAGLVSTQIGTLVKLIRVMMLGPLVACIAVFGRGLRGDRTPDGSWQTRFFQTVPWFIVAFFVLATLRSLSLLPDAAIFPMRKVANILTIMSMAGARPRRRPARHRPGRRQGHRGGDAVVVVSDCRQPRSRSLRCPGLTTQAITPAPALRTRPASAEHAQIALDLRRDCRWPFPDCPRA